MLTQQEEHRTAGQHRGDDVPEHARRQLGDVLRADRHEREGDAGRHRHGDDEHAEELQQRQQPAERLLRAR